MIVRIQGGLGNQMFQYAFAKALSVQYGAQVYLDNSGFSTNSFVTKRDYRMDIFNVSLSLADERMLSNSKGLNSNRLHDKILKKIIRYCPFLATNIRLEKSLLFNQKNTDKCDYYEGYWQTEKYFDSIKEIILQEFVLKNSKELAFSEIFKSISELESVSIHVRRGDYVNNPKVNQHHGSLPIDYYHRAIDFVKDSIPNASFFVFSDDIDWVKTNAFENLNAVFVKTSSDEEDLYLMSKCKHNIIANSSFSWWGAYLNTNPTKIVMAPLTWFRNEKNNKLTSDLIPTNWRRI